MAGWFVFQRDLYPQELSPDTLGVSLVPVYDSTNRLKYRDPPANDLCGLRRVCAQWGVERDVVHYDIVVRPPANGSMSHVDPPTKGMLTWYPREEAIRFVPVSGGFLFENLTKGLQIRVVREDRSRRIHATLRRLLRAETDCNMPHTQGTTTPPPVSGSIHDLDSGCPLVSVIAGVRVHKLTLVAPGDDGWFSKQVASGVPSERTCSHPTPDYTTVPCAAPPPPPPPPPRAHPPPKSTTMSQRSQRQATPPPPPAASSAPTPHPHPGILSQHPVPVSPVLAGTSSVTSQRSPKRSPQTPSQEPTPPPCRQGGGGGGNTLAEHSQRSHWGVR